MSVADARLFDDLAAPSRVRSNRLFYGDYLTIMQNMPSACVDLIYLDPPFNSQRTLARRDATARAARRIRAVKAKELPLRQPSARSGRQAAAAITLYARTRHPSLSSPAYCM